MCGMTPYQAERIRLLKEKMADALRKDESHTKRLSEN